MSNDLKVANPVKYLSTTFVSALSLGPNINTMGKPPQKKNKSNEMKNNIDISLKKKNSNKELTVRN